MKDVDFGYRQLLVRKAKGRKDRVVPLPDTLVAAMRAQIESAQALHVTDLSEGLGAVFMPDALARKFPSADREWVWQYVFPSSRLSVDPRTQAVRRHHVHQAGLQRAVRRAAVTVMIPKKVTCHALRYAST